MDRFIEVVGIGGLIERVAEYRADVTVLARAARVETAIDEVSDLRVAGRAGLRLVGVAEVEELDAKMSRSGAYGDADWGWPPMAAGASAEEAGGEALDAATRSSDIRLRVRFAAEPEA